MANRPSDLSDLPAEHPFRPMPPHPSVLTIRRKPVGGPVPSLDVATAPKASSSVTSPVSVPPMTSPVSVPPVTSPASVPPVASPASVPPVTSPVSILLSNQGLISTVPLNYAVPVNLRLCNYILTDNFHPPLEEIQADPRKSFRRTMVGQLVTRHTALTQRAQKLQTILREKQLKCPQIDHFINQLELMFPSLYPTVPYNFPESWINYMDMVQLGYMLARLISCEESLTLISTSVEKNVPSDRDRERDRRP